MEQKARREYVPFAVRAFKAAALDYVNEAFDLLEQAVQDRDGMLMFFTTERTIEAIRKDYRYAKVLMMMRVPLIRPTSDGR